MKKSWISLLSIATLLIAITTPTSAGRVKALLLEAEEMIFEEMNRVGDYQVMLEDPQLSATPGGVMVTATVIAYNNLTFQNELFVCEVTFEGQPGKLEPVAVSCY